MAVLVAGLLAVLLLIGLDDPEPARHRHKESVRLPKHEARDAPPEPIEPPPPWTSDATAATRKALEATKPGAARAHQQAMDELRRQAKTQERPLAPEAAVSLASLRLMEAYAWFERTGTLGHATTLRAFRAAQWAALLGVQAAPEDPIAWSTLGLSCVDELYVDCAVAAFALARLSPTAERDATIMVDLVARDAPKELQERLGILRARGELAATRLGGPPHTSAAQALAETLLPEERPATTGPMSEH